MYNNEEERHANAGGSEERIPSFFKFEDLRVYHKSLDYVTWLQEISVVFPENEKTQLVVRFNEAARNISIFIAEGTAGNKTQFVQSLRTAQSAIRESLTYTNIAYRSGLINDSYEDISRNYLMELTKMTGALINSLQRVTGSNSYGNENSSYRGGSQNNHSRRYVNEDDNQRNDYYNRNDN